MTGLAKRDLATLRKCQFFSELPARSADNLLGEAVVREFAKGEFIWKPGDNADRIMALLQGRLAILAKTPTGYDVASVFTAGNVMAGGIRAGRKMVFAGFALDKCRIVFVHSAKMRRSLPVDIHLANAMARLYADRAVQLWSQLRDMKSLTANQRLAAYLTRLAGRATGRTSFRLPDDQKVVADLIGVTRESLSRSFAQLRTQGVEKSGREVTIKNAAALRRYAAPR